MSASLLLAADAFERSGAGGLHVHEATIGCVTLHPVAGGRLGLGAALNSAYAVSVAGGRVLAMVGVEVLM